MHTMFRLEVLNSTDVTSVWLYACKMVKIRPKMKDQLTHRLKHNSFKKLAKEINISNR